MPNSGEITGWLEQWSQGDPAALDRLAPLVYDQLRAIADNLLRNEAPDHTLQPTALVSETFLKLLDLHKVSLNDRSHFFATAAQAMRRILVDHARARRAAKRDGGRHKVELSEMMAISEDRLEEALAVDEALTRLAEWDPRQCRVVELRFFGGLTEDETAKVLGIAPRTVKRDWKVARAWLHGELSRAGE